MGRDTSHSGRYHAARPNTTHNFTPSVPESVVQQEHQEPPPPSQPRPSTLHNAASGCGASAGQLQVLAFGYTARVDANQRRRPDRRSGDEKKSAVKTEIGNRLEVSSISASAVARALTHGNFVTKGSDGCTAADGGSWRLPRACYRPLKRWARPQPGSQTHSSLSTPRLCRQNLHQIYTLIIRRAGPSLVLASFD
ncbi:hypothetical protein BDV96DRAFT_205527 [Lophiotrema nucula]|uniref:Uncharacterized protein n=1 Tax=Lophiotrema nucula TaxID=690887 RepID=A0A6A5ZNZ9_9PLEO|nr:hypothetical protein BDV96DRAFT_205527 [Lophiotrema nucula]